MDLFKESWYNFKGGHPEDDLVYVLHPFIIIIICDIEMMEGW